MVIKLKWFQYAVAATILLFIVIMMGVSWIAQSRRSGSTGIDASMMMQIRHEKEHSSQTANTQERE